MKYITTFLIASILILTPTIIVTADVTLPTIGVNDLIVKGYTYTPGEPIDAQLYVQNLMNTPADFAYMVEVQQAKRTEVETGVLLSKSSLSEIQTLAVGEKKKIQIKHIVPEFIKGDVIFNIRIYNGAGIELSQKNVYLIDSVNTKGTSNVNKKLDSGISSPQIDKVQLMEGGNVFDASAPDAKIVVNKNNKLTIRLFGKNLTKESLIKIERRDVYGDSKMDVEYASFPETNNSTLDVPVDTSNLNPGLYEWMFTPINIDKVELGPTRKITFGIDGATAVVRALDGDASEINKGIFTVKVVWAPLFESTTLDENNNFTAQVYLSNKEGVVLSTTTVLTNIENIFEVKLPVPPKVLDVVATVNIYSGDVLLASYTRDLYSKTRVIAESSSLFENLKVIVVSIVLLMVALLLMYKIRKKEIAMLLIITVFGANIPTTAYAAWTLKTPQASLTNMYPKNDSDSSATTWSTLYSPWNATASYSASCATKTAGSGASSNYVLQTLPELSGDRYMYPYENSWYHIPISAWSWYWANSARNSIWPAIGTGTGTQIPGVFAESSFIHAHTLAKNASIDDDITKPENYSSWSRLRPIRLSSSNGMGTNPTYALATSTFSNIYSWLSARFNAFAYAGMTTVATNNSGFIARGGVRPVNTFLGAADALPIDYINNGADVDFTPSGANSLRFPNNSSNANAVKSMLGIATTTVSYWLDASGYGTHANSNSSSGYLTSDDVPYLNSRPGTYKLFNFLLTYRDEPNGASKVSTQKFDCVSANMQIYENTYEIVPNSFVEIVMFNDLDGNGTFEPESGEKKISTRFGGSSEITSGSMINIHFPSIKSTCQLPNVLDFSSTGIASLKENAATPIAVIEEGGLWNDPRGRNKMIGGYVKTVGQVTNPLYFPDLSVSGYAPSSPLLDAVYMINPVDGNKNTNTVTEWAIASGLGRTEGIGKAFYNAGGQLTFTTGQSLCGHSIISNDGGSQSADVTESPDHFGEDISYLYENEVINNPVPGEVLASNTPYFKIPVNWALSRTYEIGVDEEGLPSGWVATTDPITLDLGDTAVGGQHFVKYFGVAYSANGVCGTATATASGPATLPTTDLCSVGSNTPTVTSSDQDFTWTCEGYGTTATDATCTKPKCQTASPYYCPATNSCVADESACTINGVCGPADTALGRTTVGTPTAPDTNLCSAGSLNGSVADGGASSFTWTCSGENGGQSSPTCDQPKCSGSLVYCAAQNQCLASCPVTSTSTLIYDVSLAPKIVRKVTDTCLLSWSTAASEELPVSCELDGVGLGSASSDVQRSTPVSVGRHTLSCENENQNQSTTTRCLLNPSFKEI